MPKIMPSQILPIIEQFFPHVRTPSPGDGQLQSSHLFQLKGIVNLVREVPPELLTAPAEQYADLVLAITIVDENAAYLTSRGGHFGIPAIRNVDVATVIHRALKICPDEMPEASPARLQFVTEPDLKANLLADLGAIDRAIGNAEWKAATVLSGAATEALLLWKLSVDQGSTLAAKNAIVSAGGLPEPGNDLERWSLSPLIQVAAYRGFIKPRTRDAAVLCAGFRNLIHPGRSLRLGEKCTRGTALSALAALEHVIEDFG